MSLRRAAPIVWIVYLIVPVAGWGLFAGRPLGALGILAIAALGAVQERSRVSLAARYLLTRDGAALLRMQLQPELRTDAAAATALLQHAGAVLRDLDLNGQATLIGFTALAETPGCELNVFFRPRVASFNVYAGAATGGDLGPAMGLARVADCAVRR